MITPAEKHDRYDTLTWQLTAAVSLNARPHFIERRVASLRRLRYGTGPLPSPRSIAHQAAAPWRAAWPPVSVSVSFASVRRRSLAAAPVVSGQVTDGGGLW